MLSSNENLREKINSLCARISTDPLLVQGAGGNVSWKERDVLWVKASGTWLEDAATKDIFVPVDLRHLREELEKKNVDFTPHVIGSPLLKPSIETLLHGLMPHKVVIHLHAVEVLAHLVHESCQAILDNLLRDFPRWKLVGFYMPGKDLAKAIHLSIRENPDVNVLFLQNHGLVIGGECVNEVEITLQRILDLLKTNIADFLDKKSDATLPELKNYVPIPDADIQRLAADVGLFSRLEGSWAICPDHVVFLGAKPHIYWTKEEFLSAAKSTGHYPELIFIHDSGVYANNVFNRAKHAQLRCFFEVLRRQQVGSVLHVLSASHISALLNWEEEKYRVMLSK